VSAAGPDDGEDAVAVVAGIAAGRRAALARGLSWLERADPRAAELARAFPATGARPGHVIGVTGAPGAGKSTLIARLVDSPAYRDRSVAVLLLDPVSPISGGALLADRVRFGGTPRETLFVRSIPAPYDAERSLVQRVLVPTLALLGAAGFDVVLVETVGAGQDPSPPVRVVDTLVLLVTPDAGDATQLRKRGVLELVDVLVLNRADAPRTAAARRNLATSLPVLSGRPVVETVASTGAGVTDLARLLVELEGRPDAARVHARRRPAAPSPARPAGAAAVDDPVAAVTAALDAVDPEVGAFITLCADDALRAARAHPGGRLAGVVLAVKDLVDVAGVRTTYGSARYADHVPGATAPVVAELCRSGAVMIGKTNLNEFAYGVTGLNPYFGPVLVPHDRARTAGGSSGGSAAAVAMGACDVGIGTDTSGSVRIPAACCGVWGFKCASSGRLAGVHPLAPTYDSLGYLTRGPEMLQRVLDIAELPDPATLRIATVGVDIEVPALPGEHWMIFREEAWRVHEAQLLSDPESFGADVRRKLAAPRGDLAAAVEAETRWRQRYAAAVAGLDVVVSPVMDGAAPLLTAAQSDYDNGELLVSDRLLRHTPVANALGWPALAFPSPTGPLQVMGRPGSEPALIAVAMATT
jgi:aspartyl-tRNA(Asn)/glutamyl-tRNA(Gln) amidotransferase subunit A